MVSRKQAGFVALLLASFVQTGFAQEDGPEENASNPLAKVKNTDLRLQYFDLGSGNDLNDYYVEGAFMPTDSLKLKYELHYWDTNLSGSSQNGWESVRLKGIYFPTEGVQGNLKYRVAVGMDWILDLGDVDKGIGTGADQVAPFVGVALGLPSGDSLIPLLQHNQSYSGNDVSFTTLRTIWIRTLPGARWLKGDAKFTVDWENDRETPASVELQYGKNLTRNFALYFDALVGLGHDRLYDWGIGVGFRANY